MRRALELAELGWGRVHPNPLVGAVVVGPGGEVLGEGAHLEFGGPHAEVEALRQAGEHARGATMYVTLEPCTHHGKTPPCTDAVLRAGVSRVVFATEDPHAEAGGGAARLREAGLEVVAGVERDRARRQNALFLEPLERRRLFVALKLAVSLDGKLARRPGEATRVTGAAAEAEVHRLRAGFDAILVGGRTALVDDPQLTIRHAPASRVAPVRVIADPAAALPSNSRLASTAKETPVWLLAAPDAPPRSTAELRHAGVDVIEVERAAAGLDLRRAISVLWDRGIRTVLCEGGGRLGASLLEAGLVDRIYLFIASSIYGPEGVPAFPGLAEPAEWSLSDARTVAEDALLVLDRKN